MLTRRLEHASRVAEAILDGGADLVGRNRHHIVHQLIADPKRLGAYSAHGGAIGEEANRVERGEPPLLMETQARRYGERGGEGRLCV